MCYSTRLFDTTLIGRLCHVVLTMHPRRVSSSVLGPGLADHPDRSGAYWITLCTDSRRPLLGSLSAGAVELSPAGRIVQQEWLRTTRYRSGLALDCFVIMPDRLQAILWVAEKPSSWAERVTGRRRRAGTLASVLDGFKDAGTAQIRLLLDDPTLQVWQPSYYEHVIRDEARLGRVRRHIQENRVRWCPEKG